MKILAILGAMVAVVAANPMGDLWRSVAPRDGQFVVAKDYSLEDGVEYFVKYVQPYTPGKPLPVFPRDMDSSEEVYHYLASKQGRKHETWSDKVKKLRHVLATGLDISTEGFHPRYSARTLPLPADRQYFMDASGEIYYEEDHRNTVKAVKAL